MLGLEPNTPMEQCALAAFQNNKKGGIVECSLMIMFKGMMDLARRSEEVKDFMPAVVYEGDIFEHELGTTPRLVHKPIGKDRSDDKITHAYSVAFLSNGATSFKVMTVDEIAKHRAKSKQGNGSFWKDHYPAMCMKTVIRQHCKTLPRCAELARALKIEDAAEQGKVVDWSAIDLPESAVNEIQTAETAANE